ncbi:MAG TPA: AAA family ATPase, partial [Kofleriaceae bacterium]
MLRHLRVTNFAILSDVAIELGEGMNVLTGETGAGKSLIVEAVNLLRGGRASADIPRAGTDEAVVEAIVAIPEDLAARVAGVLEGAGASGGDPEVVIRRVIQRGGRSRTYVNGALTTLARLAELGALLIDLSGQHQHQGLVD